jgi:hypothetical protein
VGDRSIHRQLVRVQASVRRHLAAQVGVSNIYRAAVEAFDIHSLQVRSDALVWLSLGGRGEGEGVEIEPAGDGIGC